MSFWRMDGKWGVWIVLVFTLAITCSNIWVIFTTQGRVISDFSQVPHNKVALVLGTSNKLVNGDPNPFFVHRMERAAQLYKMKKIDHFIHSCDNRTKYY